MQKILIAEDDPGISDMYKMGFETAGFAVVQAFDGEETLRKAGSEHPDFIVLDILMPKKEGMEVLAELKANVSTRSTPVIILTNLGTGREEDIKIAQEFGAEDMIVKAQTIPSEVVTRVKKILAERGMPRQ